MKWLDMNLAPTDGDEILAFDAEAGRVLLVFYHDGEWLTEGGTYARELTHWMPLPDFPET